MENRIVIICFQWVLFIAPIFINLFIGLWLIHQYPKIQESILFGPVLWGLIVFETTIIGMVMDPAKEKQTIIEIIKIAFIIGLANSLFVFLFTPIFGAVLRISQCLKK